jgi:hypothetical protein
MGDRKNNGELVFLPSSDDWGCVFEASKIREKGKKELT